MRVCTMHLRWLSAGLAIAVGLAAWLGFAGPARASIGVGVQASPVSLSGAAHPGASYALPSLYIVNTGSQAESMSVRVVRRTGPGLAIPESWIRIGSLSGKLPPRQSARIALELVTPADAQPGNYVGDIVVTGSTAPVAAGVNFGAAAATKLEFTITPGPAAGSWLSFPPWTWWAIGGLVVLAAATFGWRRSGLRIRVERKNAA
jgi:hypothetical protein